MLVLDDSVRTYRSFRLEHFYLPPLLILASFDDILPSSHRRHSPLGQMHARSREYQEILRALIISGRAFLRRCIGGPK